MTRRAMIGGLVALSVTPAVAGCSRDDETAGTAAPTMNPSSYVDFPPPTESSVALEVALRHRRSAREFATDPLTTAEIGQLLWAAQGVTADWGGRTAPSAGALYPLELYAVTPERVLRYVSEGHRGEITAERDLRPDLMAAALDQAPIGGAPLVVAVAGVPARTAEKYGDRAPRYVDLEAGHAAQNLLLQVVAMDLAAVPIGAFHDRDAARVLALPEGRVLRYLIAVGHPREPDRDQNGEGSANRGA